MSASSQDKRHEQEAFDAWAAESGWRTFTDDSMQRLARWFVREVAGPGRILDLACGTGEYTEQLAREAGARRVFAADLSTQSVRACLQRVPDAGVLAADAEGLPLRDGSFSSVFLGNVLHHFPEPSSLLREVFRVLEPGGRIFAIDPNRQNPIVYLYRVVLGSRSMKTDNEVLHRWARMRELLGRAGFDDVRVEAALPMYFVREYYARNLGTLVGSAATVPLNAIERLLFASRRAGAAMGSFVTSRATKPLRR